LGFAAAGDGEGDLTVCGRTLEYRWLAPRTRSGPVLVLLHEGLGSVSMWRDFPDRLAAASGCGVFAYSRFGYGRSAPAILPRKADYMHVEALVVLPELLRVAGLGDTVLVGHSDGGSIAVIAAGVGRVPSARALVLLAPHVFNEELSVRSIAEARQAWRYGDLPARLARYHGARTENAFRGWNDIWLHPDFLTWNIEACLAGIDLPLLMIQGRDDQYGTWRQVEAIRDGVAGPFTLEYLDACRHSPHRDRPDATLEAIVRFVRAL
jgi:pimeloyl-ACP methyl ester carboxylesterase